MPNNEHSDLIANRSGQPLAEHCFAVGILAESIAKELFPDNKKIQEDSFLSGVMHDPGKGENYFQDHIRSLISAHNDLSDEDISLLAGAKNKKFSFKDHPRHNEVSALFLRCLETLFQKTYMHQLKKKDDDVFRVVANAVYWHHPQVYRSEEAAEQFKTYSGIYEAMTSGGTKSEEDFDELMARVHQLLKDIETLTANYYTSKKLAKPLIPNSIKGKNFKSLADDTSLVPTYKSYSEKGGIDKFRDKIEFNARCNIVRACLITADRLVSAMTKEALLDAVKPGSSTLSDMAKSLLTKNEEFSRKLQDSLTKFHPDTERTREQNRVVDALIPKKADGANERVRVLAGKAGDGKTKMSLDWAAKTKAQRIIWVCPRVQVCQGLFKDLTTEYGFDASVKIEIHSGEFKYINEWGKPIEPKEHLSGDIILTTIDQVIGGVVGHTQANNLISFLDTHVIFDEFHEYVNMPVFNLLFAELIRTKELRKQNVNTLLVSATPHYTYLDRILGIKCKDVHSTKSFNTTDYRIEIELFDEAGAVAQNPLFTTQTDVTTIVVSNTVKTAQQAYLMDTTGDTILYHSKLKKSDKASLFEEVFNSFCRNGTKLYRILRSGPGVQASLNINGDGLISEFSTPEDILQRIGRLNRFGEPIGMGVNICLLAVPTTIQAGCGDSSATRFLRSRNVLDSTRAWYVFLEEQIRKLKEALVSKGLANPEDYTIKLETLYDWYKAFHIEIGLAVNSPVEEDLLKALKQSAVVMRKKVYAPFVKAPVKNKTRARISARSLRGDNFNVQMAKLYVDANGQCSHLDEYAYALPDASETTSDIDNLSQRREVIVGYGDDLSDDLLIHMWQCHKDMVVGDSDSPRVLLAQARNPESPIYLSYTSKDLDGQARHKDARYYVVSDRQPVGVMKFEDATLYHRNEQTEDAA